VASIGNLGIYRIEDDRTAVARFLSLIPLPEPAAPVRMKRRSIGSEPPGTPSTRRTSERARATTPLRYPPSGARRTPETRTASARARLDNHDPRPLLALDTLRGKARRRRHGRVLELESTADVLLTKPPMFVSGALPFYWFCRQKGEPTSGLLRTAYPCSSYEFACTRSSPYWCVR
jgi:hypothetical protein